MKSQAFGWNKQGVPVPGMKGGETMPKSALQQLLRDLMERLQVVEDALFRDADADDEEDEQEDDEED